MFWNKGPLTNGQLYSPTPVKKIQYVQSAVFPFNTHHMNLVNTRIVQSSQNTDLIDMKHLCELLWDCHFILSVDYYIYSSSCHDVSVLPQGWIQMFGVTDFLLSNMAARHVVKIIIDLH